MAHFASGGSASTTIVAEIAKFEKAGWTCRAFATRSDGYIFFLCTHAARKKPTVFAGCRYDWTIGNYRRHAARYVRPGKRRETLAILDLFACHALKWSK